VYAFVYLYSGDVSLTGNADKAFLKTKWAKPNFPHINFGLALIYQNQKKFDRKGDPNWLSQQKIEIRAFLKAYFIETVCTTFAF